MFFLKCFSCAFSFVLLANVFQYLLIPSELNKSHHDEESLDPDPDPDPSLDLDEFSRQIRNKIILEHWLQANDWEHLIHWLQQLEVHSLQDFSRLDLPEEGEKYFTHDISEDLEEAAAYLPAPEALPGLERLIWEQILEAKPEIIPSSTKDKTTSPPSPPISTRSLAMTYLGWFIIFFLGLFLYDLGVTPNDVLWGVPLHKSLTQITLPDNLSASNTKTVSVSFFNMKGQPLDVSEHLEEFRAEAWFQYQAVNAFVSPETSGASNVVQVR